MENDSHSTYDSSTNNTWYSSWLYSLLSTNDKRGSLQLLSADCYSYLLLKRRKYLKETTLTISRSCIRVNSEKMEHLINLSRQKLTSNKSKYNPLDNLKECCNGWDFNASYVTRPRVTRHTFLEGITQINHWRCTEGMYRWVFYEFEDYVIKLFSIHPTLWSATRGAFLDDDGSVLNSCLNYIRFYESAMHLLSQKLHHHFYLTLFILIVLLRNVRRLLHHFKTNSAFFELILIMVEGIHLCQNHLYNTFMSDERIFRSPLHEKYEDHLSYEEMELKNIRKQMAVTQSLESIKSYNDGCNNYKTDICSICKDEKLKLELDSSREGSMAGDNNRATWSGESARDEELISLSVDSDLFGLYGTTCPRLTNRQDHFSSSLDYDNSEIFHLQYLNVVLDCEISKWISELCKLATVYCKVGRGPVLLERKYTKLVPDSKSSVIPGLCTPGFTNLSLHRSLKHRGAGLYKWKRRIQQRERKRHYSFVHRSKQNLHEEILSRIQSISESISKSLSQSQSLPQSSRSSLSHTPHKSTLLSQSHLHIRDQSPAEYISHSKQLLKRFEYTDDSSSSRSSADVTPVIKSVSRGKEPKTITPVKVKTKTSPRKKKKSGKSSEKPKKSKYQKWNLEEVQLFIKALNTYGDGKWRHIEKMYFLGKKSQAQLKDKWVNLVKFGHIKKVEIIRENGTIGRIWVPVESPSSNNI